MFPTRSLNRSGAVARRAALASEVRRTQKRPKHSSRKVVIASTVTPVKSSFSPLVGVGVGSGKDGAAVSGAVDAARPGEGSEDPAESGGINCSKTYATACEPHFRLPGFAGEPNRKYIKKAVKSDFNKNMKKLGEREREGRERGLEKFVNKKKRGSFFCLSSTPGGNSCGHQQRGWVCVEGISGIGFFF